MNRTSFPAAGAAASAEAAASSQNREKLDVESPEERQERLGRLFVSKSPSNPSSLVQPVSLPATRPEIGLLPQSDILSRVRDFLPLLASSNESLLQQARLNPDAVNIENVKGDSRVIEMDLGLGVFDVRGQAGKDMGPEMDIPEPRPDDEDEEEDGEDEDEDKDEDEDMEDSSDSSDSSSEEGESEDEEAPPQATGPTTT